jgi:hypothetical protein
MSNFIKIAEPQPAWYIRSMSKNDLRDYIIQNLKRKWGPLNDWQYRLKSDVDHARFSYNEALRELMDRTAKLTRRGAGSKYDYSWFRRATNIKNNNKLELAKLLKKYKDVDSKAAYLKNQIDNPEYIARVANRYRNLANAKAKTGLLSKIKTGGKWALPGIAAALTYSGVQALRSKDN